MSSSQTVSDVLSAINTALSAGNGTVAQSLAQMLMHGTSSPTQGLDFTKKTMTTSWYQNNQSNAIPLVAAGWTIIPG